MFFHMKEEPYALISPDVAGVVTHPYCLPLLVGPNTMKDLLVSQ